MAKFTSPFNPLMPSDMLPKMRFDRSPKSGVTTRQHSSSSSSSAYHLQFVVERARQVIESIWPDSIMEKLAEYLLKIPDNRKVMFETSRSDQGILSAIVRIESPELCARIIGRNGLNVIYVRSVTNSRIHSPRINAGRSDCCFNIEAFALIDLITAVYIINLLADYFSIKMDERLELKEEEDIRVEIGVDSRLVPYLLHDRGCALISMREIYKVNITSPKPYSDDCKFYIIGKPNNVEMASKELMQYIENVSNLMMNQGKIQNFL